MRSEVRFFPGPLRNLNLEISNLRFLNRGSGDVAQLGERWLCKPEVAGSIPVVSIDSPQVNPVGYLVKLFDKLICGCSKFFIVFLNVASPFIF